MASSVYRVIDVIGTSDNSWEDATAAAVATASGSLRDLRVAEVTKLDVTIGDDGKVQQYRARLAPVLQVRERLSARGRGIAVPASPPGAATPSRASAVRPTSASSPTHRAPPWSAPATWASSGTHSRVWSVPGPVGSLPWSAVTTTAGRPGRSAASSGSRPASMRSRPSA